MLAVNHENYIQTEGLAFLWGRVTPVLEAQGRKLLAAPGSSFLGLDWTAELVGGSGGISHQPLESPLAPSSVRRAAINIIRADSLCLHSRL